MKEILVDEGKKQAFHHFKETHKERFCLKFNYANGNFSMISYDHLAFVEFKKTSLTVHYIHSTVKITGQDLRALGRAIGRREAGEITEKHTTDKLAQGAAYIDRIEIKDR